MADPFTALGTASSVLAFVEFSWKLLTNTYSTYKSATGESEDARVLFRIAEDATRFGNAITMAPGCEADLRRLVEEAKSIAEELLDILEKLKVQGTKTAWKSFVVALNELWQSSEVKSLSERLTKLQNAMILHIQKLLLNDVSGIPHRIARLERTSKELDTTMKTGFCQLRRDVAEAAGKFQPGGSICQDMEMHLRNWDGTKPLDYIIVQKLSMGLYDLLTKASHLHELGKETEKDQSFLKSLYFTGITARHRNIAEAHARTFAWIFQGKPPEFVNWLEHSSDVFWIQGKPGSGKSTLMKFISNHERMRSLLKLWTGDKKLVTSTFFFWNAGSRLQKSQEGLFRSLLFGILRSRPHLVPRVSELRIKLRDDLDDDWSWTVDELRSVLRRTIEECKDTKFCFFIDGMDEFQESKAELDILIKNIQDLSKMHNVKLCLSSRPWSMFDEAFGKNRELSLRVEDLTRRDIEQYVSDKFQENPSFVQRQKENPMAIEAVVQEICQRAAGVFLWVYLVVRDLLVGFTNADSLEKLQERLRRFPDHLNAFFRQMINDVDPIYHLSTARMFEIAKLAPEPQLAVAYSFIDDIEQNIEFAIETPVEPMSDLEFETRITNLKRQLDARSKGLLEVVVDGTFCGDIILCVDFLHRTVREFLDIDDSLRLFLDQKLRGSNVGLMMCSATLAALKKLRPYVYGLDPIDPLHIIKNFLDWAVKADKEIETLPILSRVLNYVDSPDGLARHCAGGLPRNHFFSLVCERNIPSYIEPKLSADPRCLYGAEVSILHYALTRAANRDPQPRIIKMLLDHGANPNQLLGSTSVWIRFAKLVVGKKLLNNGNIKHIIALLISHKADLGDLETQPSLREFYAYLIREGLTEDKRIVYSGVSTPSTQYDEDAALRWIESTNTESNEPENENDMPSTRGNTKWHILEYVLGKLWDYLRF
ncbi:hypothetical protein F5Y11DRAFT_148903 [Daldinia sp. FL1419]|nr:hypothetical protein F5Y11DRAFT_148903 [Daldinia sp. FL1419]